MTSSLNDIPGTDGDGQRHALKLGNRKGRRRHPWRSGRLEFAPRPLAFEEGRTAGPTVFRKQPKRIEVGTVFAALVALGTIAFVAVLAYRATRVDVDQAGLQDGAVLNGADAAALEVRLAFGSSADAKEASLSFDGEAVEEPTVKGSTLVWRPPGELAEGEHRLTLSVPRPVLDDARRTWRFTVDLTPPALEVPGLAEAVAIDEPAEVVGKAEPRSTVRADGDEVDVDADGGFALSYVRAPAGPIALEAVDEAGNRTAASVTIPVRYPSLRGVHVSAAAWGNEQLRNGILRLVDEGRIDTVQLDLKDDQGVVGYDTNVERAHQIGAVTVHYDLDDAVRALQERGARVIGRIVAFRDPTLAQAAWGAGQTTQVIQSAAGGPYGTPGQYTNFADPAVRRYNLDIALDAVNRGVDDILWDDTRRPGGDPAAMAIPGLASSASDSIAGFLAEAHTELRRRAAYQGVTTDGEAAERGDLVGQDVARIAANADYVAPQIFPGYWSDGRYDIADPATQPGELVRAVLQGFQRAAADRGAVLAPWLQDFPLEGVSYGDAEVRAQIDAAASLGVDRFLLWDPSVTYTAGALAPS
ncbi:MAG TPA: putative glycoside hydrolase [Acidimicrobiales bacterium]|nr:putative glycoside hydrolase [Acidimicrobiales bacterium]